MSEAALVRRIIANVKSRWPDAYIRKLADRHSRGIPDLLIIAAGVWLLVEAKAPGGRVSALQSEEHVAIARAGGQVTVATTAELVLQVFEQLGARGRGKTLPLLQVFSEEDESS